MAGGRPPLWGTVEELEKALEGFDKWNEDNDYIPDIEGLAVYLGTSRKTILDYENKEEFSYTIKRVKTKIAFHKKQLALKGKIPAAIFCFDFHNNHGYVNREIIIKDKEPEEVNIDDLKKEIIEDIKENGFSYPATSTKE